MMTTERENLTLKTLESILRTGVGQGGRGIRFEAASDEAIFVSQQGKGGGASKRVMITVTEMD